MTRETLPSPYTLQYTYTLDHLTYSTRLPVRRGGASSPLSRTSGTGTRALASDARRAAIGDRELAGRVAVLALARARCRRSGESTLEMPSILYQCRAIDWPARPLR